MSVAFHNNPTKRAVCSNRVRHDGGELHFAVKCWWAQSAFVQLSQTFNRSIYLHSENVLWDEKHRPTRVHEQISRILPSTLMIRLILNVL